MTRGLSHHLRNNPIEATDDGLHLHGSILWLDSLRKGDLSFLSSPIANKRFCGPQFLATEETVKILQINRKQAKALICQYNRPISLGKLKIELLPSGGSIGTAILSIESDMHSILYAPHIQTQQIGIVRKAQLRKAETLVLEASLPEFTAVVPNRKKEKEKIIEQILSLAEVGKFPTIYCQQTMLAQEIVALVNQYQIIPEVDSEIYRINKIYEGSGSKLGRYLLHSTKRQKPKLKILSLRKLARELPTDEPIIIVEDKIQDSIDKLGFNTDSVTRYYLSSECHSRELKEAINLVDPNNIYIFGPYAKRYVEELKNCSRHVQQLYPNHQPTLF